MFHKYFKTGDGQLVKQTIDDRSGDPPVSLGCLALTLQWRDETDPASVVLCWEQSESVPSFSWVEVSRSQAIAIMLMGFFLSIEDMCSDLTTPDEEIESEHELVINTLARMIDEL